MSWPDAAAKMVESVCWMVVLVAIFGAVFGIDININRKDKK